MLNMSIFLMMPLQLCIRFNDGTRRHSMSSDKIRLLSEKYDRSIYIYTKIMCFVPTSFNSSWFVTVWRIFVRKQYAIYPSEESHIIILHIELDVASGNTELIMKYVVTSKTLGTRMRTIPGSASTSYAHSHNKRNVTFVRKLCPVTQRQHITHFH